jgi:TfoX/Sxy family transcriptional regulator of competence genes
MDGEGLKALFEPFGLVTVRRMFGGAAGYAEGLCFAIEANGEVDIKADALSQPSFSASGSVPFTYVMRRWVGLGLEAARPAAAAKGERKGKSTLPAKRRAKSKRHPA